MAVSRYPLSAVLEATERMERRLRDKHSATSNVQGAMAVFQLIATVYLNAAAWAWPGRLTASSAAPCVALLAVVLLVWHVALRSPVLSPVACSVLLLQLAARACVGQGLLLSALTLPPVLLAAAVNQRSLENLVHEASHHCLYRSAHLNGCAAPGAACSPAPAGFAERLQRMAATLFAALVFKDIEAYHGSHSVHHRHFGDAARDPDTSIYERAKVASLAAVARATLCWYWDNLQGALHFARELARRAEQRLALAVAVAAAALADPVTMAACGSIWLAAYFAVLPPLRMVAEQEEHAMLIPEPEALAAWLKEDGRHRARWLALEADPEGWEGLLNELLARLQWTMSRTNAGWLHRWVFHPCGDGFHAVHHLSPRVPFHRLREAHRDLLASEPIFAALCHHNPVPVACAFEWRRR